MILMSSKRDLTKGVIRLEGPAIVRPVENPPVCGLTPAAVEMISGIRSSAGITMSTSEHLEPPSAILPQQSPRTPVNYTEDWWGE